MRRVEAQNGRNAMENVTSRLATLSSAR